MSNLLSNGPEVNGKNITIDSGALEGVIANINADKATIEQVAKKLSTSFSPLTNSGLFENCLSSLQVAVSSISLTYEMLGTTISSHLNEVTTIEDSAARIANNYMSLYDSNSYGTGGSSYNVGGVDLSNVIPLKHINSEKLQYAIANLDSSSISSMVSFMCMVKDEDKTLAEILFDSNNKDYCATLLQNFFKVYGSVDISLEDSSKIHETILKKVLSSGDQLPKDLTKATILQFSNYLESVAKNNGMTSFDLITNSSNKSLLTKSLKDLYDNNINDSSFDEEYCLEFKAFVNMKAEKENKTVDEVLEDINNLL